MSGTVTRGEELFAKGEIEQARRCFLDALEENADDKQALNDLGVLSFHTNETAQAVEYFERALAIDPDYEECRRNMTIMRQQEEPSRGETTSRPSLTNARVAIVNPFQNKFNRIYSDYFSRENEVRLVLPKTERDLLEIMDWAEVIWTTWCNEPLRFMSRRGTKATLVTHVRSYEILTPSLMTGVRWENVQGAIFVADHIREIANQMWSEQLRPTPQTTVFNCVELDRYPFYDKSPGKNVAYIGYLNHKKGIPLLLQCIQKAVERDPGYRFHVAGSFQEPRFEVYMNHLLREIGLTDHVTFNGWVRDVPAFLADMDYVVSTSPWEGCPNNVIEAMACGVKPLVHNWRGAATLFGRELVFNTVDEFIALLTSSDYDSRGYRDLVDRRFNAPLNLPQIDAFMAGLHNGEQVDSVSAKSVKATAPSRPTPAPVPPVEPTSLARTAQSAAERSADEQTMNCYQPLPRDVGVTIDRKRFTIDLCRGRRVLHIGCVDAGMMKQRMAENQFLHYHIHQVAERAIGVDIDKEGLALLSENGYEVHRLDLETDDELLTSLSEQVDLIVIPEVLEHLSNPGRALDNLRRSGFQGDILMTVPNAFSFRAFSTLAGYQELVHPDHNYWFSPTTLKTLLGKHGFEVRHAAMYYNRAADAIGLEFDRFMKTCPYYGDGLAVVVRARAEATEEA